MIALNKINSSISSSFLIVILSIFFTSCHQNKRTDVDTPSSGTIHISVDESFKPVIDSQIQVFEALYPKTKIIAEYKPEAECFKDLIKDSTRMIIVTRGLTPEEEKFYKDSLSYSPTWSKVANDAIAVIENREAKDSLYSMDQIRGILDGSSGDKTLAVFDGLKETSTVRFAIDSILKGKPLDPKKVFAEDGSQQVIDYVSTHKGALGFVGVSWIGNPEDSNQLTFLNKVRIVSIQCSCPEQSYIKPYQANIILKRYPMIRGLYYIIKENYNGLGSGFATFLEYERGQLIFSRAYLAPGKMNFTIRKANNE
ncbi:MAG: substrate-binding domain-containing protein [Ginsengibacter sp.]